MAKWLLMADARKIPEQFLEISKGADLHKCSENHRWTGVVKTAGVFQVFQCALFSMANENLRSTCNGNFASTKTKSNPRHPSASRINVVFQCGTHWRESDPILLSFIKRYVYWVDTEVLINPSAIKFLNMSWLNLRSIGTTTAAIFSDSHTTEPESRLSAKKKLRAHFLFSVFFFILFRWMCRQIDD